MIPVNPFPAGPSARSFVSGAAAAERTRVQYFRDPASDHLHATVWFGPLTEGPPHSVHGGAIAAVLDEAMGGVCWLHGHAVLGARIAVDYRHMVPIGFTGQVESWIERIDRRKLFIRARLSDEHAKVYAEGEALFVEMLPEQRKKLEEPPARPSTA